MPERPASGGRELPATVHHSLRVHGGIGHLRIAAHIDLRAPWTVLFGPSGSGKSTLLRTMCGFHPDWAIRFERLIPPDSITVLQAERIFVPPQLRLLAYVPQSAALFPHLSVRDNICFSTSLRGRNQQDADLPQAVMEMLNLVSLAARHPRNLSGGERQRVSLARALAVPDAKLLLLDEPFAGVDRTLRDTLIPALRTWCAARHLPVISVTHDVDEVFLLDAEVVRLQVGRVCAQGSAGQVLADEVERVRTALRLGS